MFSVAYVILPPSGPAPAEAIRAALAPFQRGGCGGLPDAWLAFHDETPALREMHEAALTFILQPGGGLQAEGAIHASWLLDFGKVQSKMRRRSLQRWAVRFADAMDLDAFHDAFARPLERHLGGAYGQWLNPLGRWDW